MNKKTDLLCDRHEPITRDVSLIMSPNHEGGMGGGNTVLSADPVGVGVASCPHSVSLLNGHILAKLTQIYHWEGEKC